MVDLLLDHAVEVVGGFGGEPQGIGDEAEAVGIVVLVERGVFFGIDDAFQLAVVVVGIGGGVAFGVDGGFEAVVAVVEEGGGVLFRVEGADAGDLLARRPGRPD